jgi:hypothetical protein
MLQNLAQSTILAIQSTQPSPQTIIQLLQQDEPHIQGKLLNSDIIKFYALCARLEIDACKLGQYLYQLYLVDKNCL